jgi:predicted ferric reductase
VNIPHIAKYEWHPFTISSSPDQTETIWLHIRAVGTWTKKLYDYYNEKSKKLGKLTRTSKRKTISHIIREERYV